MPHKLDELKQYETYDQQDLGFDVEHIPEQILRATKELKELNLSKLYKDCERILLVAMGGSHLSMRLLQSLVQKEGRKPVEIISDYAVPEYTNSKTLVILGSYSGGTEEVLEAAKSAKKKKAKIIAVTTGGKVAAAARRNKWPLYQFDPGDVVRTPKLGVGYTFAAYLHILKEAGAFKLTKKDFDAMIDAMIDVIDTCAIEIEQKENPAKQMAEAIEEKAVMVIAAEHLTGNAKLLQHQLEETTKAHARAVDMPGLNHHFLESMVLPENFLESWTAVMIHSKMYHKRTQRRLEVTAKLLEDQGVRVIEYHAHGKSRTEEVAEMMQFGSYASYYAAILQGIEPEHMDFVDLFKKKLGN